MLLPQSEQKAPVSRNELLSAIGALREAITDGRLDQIQPLGPAAIYTSSVTLWMLIMQRIQGGLTLDQTVKDFIGDLPDFCSNNKRINEGTLSAESGAYAGARKRLDLATVTFLFNRITNSIAYPKVDFGFRPRKTFLLDGTTITLSPTEELRREFPPATNQHGDTVWPVMLLFVAHDLETGCAMAPEVGQMYGSKADSESLRRERRWSAAAGKPKRGVWNGLPTPESAAAAPVYRRGQKFR